MRQFMTFVLLVAAGCASRKDAQKEEPTMSPKPTVVFAVRFLPGAKWIAGKPANEQPGIDDHVRNLGQWHDRELLYCGGPFLDGTGGLSVLRVSSLEKANALVAEDPAVRAGLLVSEIHPWLLAFERSE